MPTAIRPGTIFWTKEEDERLIKLVMQHGKNWRMMRPFFPQRSESSIKCRWHVYLKQHVKGEPPEFKRMHNGVIKRRKKRKPKPVNLFLTNDDELCPEVQAYSRLEPRKSGRKRVKPRAQYSPTLNSKMPSCAKLKRQKYQELNILIPTYELTGSISEANRNFTKGMLKRVRAKTDLELDLEEQRFFEKYCYSPRQGTPIADRIVATNCLASLFFTKDVPVKAPLKISFV